MYKLFEFIRSIYVVVLFVLLEIAAVSYYAHSSYYTQARLLAHSNRMVGGVHGFFAGVRHYFSLGDDNRLLLERVAQLEEQLASHRQAEGAAGYESYIAQVGATRHRIMTAGVVSNTVNLSQNLITLDRGSRDGVVEQMAVLAPDGAMVGYVIACSERYSVVMSALNTSFRASGKLSGVDYFGSIHWDGQSQYEVTLDELSKYAAPQPGQEVVSAGFSQYFPADVLIGWVEHAELNAMQTSYTVKVRLAAEMSCLRDVILIENRDFVEVEALLESEKVEQQLQRN